MSAALDSGRAPIGVGMIGYGFMGRAHSHALRNVAAVFPTLPLVPSMRVMCGRDAAAVERAATDLGWQGWCTDWRDVIGRDDVDLVIIGTPGDTHAEIAIAALQAGKHVLCEKPFANSLAEATAMAEAAAVASANGVQAMLAHNYRRVPATAVARRLVAEGRLGPLRQVRAQYLQDWLVDAAAPMNWRLDAERAGSGALGDIGSHALDLVQFVTGEQLVEVQALIDTQVPTRAWPNGDVGTVTVDDIAVFFGRMSGGAVATFEASRMATGCKNSLRFEVHGADGALRFDLERLDELWVLDRSASDGFRRVLVTEPTDPWMEAWWPPGHIIGWEHTFHHQLHDLLRAIATGTTPSPSFAEGLALQRTLAAVASAAATGTRLTVAW